MSEVIVHVIRKLPCAPNSGGSINQLRATHIKINLLVILKIVFFDYYLANCSSITMVTNEIFRLGVCRLVPWGVIPISRGSKNSFHHIPYSLFRSTN